MAVIQNESIWKVKKLWPSLSQWDWKWDGRGSRVITCDRSQLEFDICTIKNPILVGHASSNLFILGPQTLTQSHHLPVKIHPYPLKNDKTAISYVKEVTITSAPPNSKCGVTHHSPALLFSAGGYNGNFYHEINENFIPLFITINSIFSNQDVVLVIKDGKMWWFKKYEQLLRAFSPYHPIINTNNLTTTHCFPSGIIGLMKHGTMIIDPKKLLPNPKTLVDFSDFLRRVYNQNVDDDPKINKSGPHLVLVTRRGNVSRVILNQDEIVNAAKEIGFNVHELEPSRNISMAYVYNLIHKSHVILGVHGAGLTHSLFLRPGSVLVQVVPIGTVWASRTYYEKPARLLGMEYIEYMVDANESTLSEIYGANSTVVKDPEAFHQNKWSNRRIYLKKQNLRLDVVRFKMCLSNAYEKAKIFMDRVG
ncbi:hypothetical protein PIB30_028470 [Stylosanthes scabra]|uniref:Glycosyltransferase 61 catalytic domain-containing protein n=1 Tax=Stylosanthes scabra TaxID=79078 RepID=A0ABU6YBH5_9FABA|nr:hypothetical protein [Stylosanthes scabra]